MSSKPFDHINQRFKRPLLPSGRWIPRADPETEERRGEVRDDLAANLGVDEETPEREEHPVPPPLNPTTNSDRPGFQRVRVEIFQQHIPIPASPTLSNHTSLTPSTLPTEPILSITSESLQNDLAATRDELRVIRERIETSHAEINSLNERLLMATRNALNQREQRAASLAEIPALKAMLMTEIQHRWDLNQQIDAGMSRERELLDRLMVVRESGERDSKRDSDVKSRSRKSSIKKRKAKVPLGVGCFCM